jgi:hypothetical protein
MQILAFSNQIPTKLPLFGLKWGNEANGDFPFCPFGLFIGMGNNKNRRCRTSRGDYY